MANKKIKVLIVDDSLVFVNFLSKGLPEADRAVPLCPVTVSCPL